MLSCRRFARSMLFGMVFMCPACASLIFSEPPPFVNFPVANRGASLFRGRSHTHTILPDRPAKGPPPPTQELSAEHSFLEKTVIVIILMSRKSDQFLA